MTETHLSERTATLIAHRRPRVLVVGDAILDAWVSGECRRLCREAPAPVLDVTGERYAPGGAANTAVNLAALGAATSLVAAIGEDHEGALLRRELELSGVDTEALVPVPGRRTVTKRRLVAGGQLLARVDDGDRGPVPEPAAHRLRRAVTAALDRVDAVLVCDYGLGLPRQILLSALSAQSVPAPLGAWHRPLVAVDAHDPRAWAELRPDLVTPNATETERVLGTPLPADDRIEFLQRHQSDLHRATGAASVVVTLDRQGTVLLTDGEPAHRTWARPVADNQTAGAGDTFLAATCLGRLVGLPMTGAVELGQAAADVVVHEGGTAVCDTARLAERLGRLRTAVSSEEDVAERVAEHRAAGRRIVFTNGCFDLLHAGHIACLNQAKRLGDVLVVAVNSDRGVRRLKGPGRPVHPAGDRAAVLAALSCVDHVTLFDADDAIDLIRSLRPDVYVKGGDHALDSIPEAAAVRECGGQVRLLDRLPERSSTAVIDRIRASAG
ncbi:MAG TPA: D-glycero-beta-D-manno-heptose 1-phosphate adenylyltransferase [Pseudonocardiaceae bacterium]|jgi:rfaE bifunctional protein kinase chain/domain/rfaE bifunctional protein nucleotidyltransferase chain/domain|nr:D-glycero-beta-D-manno-heptose 1-phosphate adenylyltransferase [Pseudonocardiaceae bacterium]